MIIVDVKIKLNDEEVIDYVKNGALNSFFPDVEEVLKESGAIDPHTHFQTPRSSKHITLCNMISGELNRSLKEILLNPSAYRREVKIDNILS